LFLLFLLELLNLKLLNSGSFPLQIIIISHWFYCKSHHPCPIPMNATPVVYAADPVYSPIECHAVSPTLLVCQVSNNSSIPSLDTSLFTNRSPYCERFLTGNITCSETFVCRCRSEQLQLKVTLPELLQLFTRLWRWYEYVSHWYYLLVCHFVHRRGQLEDVSWLRPLTARARVPSQGSRCGIWR
jgi:hypothetical protein